MVIAPSNDKKYFPVYKTISKSSANAEIDALLQYLSIKCNDAKVDVSDLHFEERSLLEIFDRVAKRRIYCHIFHEDMEMGELNEAAIICYWLLKLRPFVSLSRGAADVNGYFALCLAIDTARVYAKKIGKPLALENNLVEMIKHLHHAFVYRNLGHEAISAMLRCLARV